MLVVFTPSFLCYIKSNAWEKFMNNIDGSRFFTHPLSKIYGIIRTCKVVDQFLWKPFWFFQRIFSISSFDMVVKQWIINFSKCKSLNLKFAKSRNFQKFPNTLNDHKIKFNAIRQQFSGFTSHRDKQMVNLRTFETDPKWKWLKWLMYF